MNNSELISIIVPIYNNDSYLEQCIESIINQTYKNLEIILIDDGSPDKCPQICDEYALKDNRIKVIHKQNGGVSSAKNAGLDIAKGDYIGFVDSDDFIEPDMYEFLYNMLTENKADVSCCNMFEFKDNEYVPNISSCEEGFLTFSEILQIKQGLYLGNKLYNKNLMYDVCFDENLFIGEDLYYNFEVLKKAKRIIYSKQAKYYYRNNIKSITRTKLSERQISDVIRFYDKTIKYCRENKLQKVIDNNKRSQFYWIVKLLYTMFQSKYEQKECLKLLLQHIKTDIGYWLFGRYGIKTKLLLLLSCIDFNIASKFYRLMLRLKIIK